MNIFPKTAHALTSYLLLAPAILVLSNLVGCIPITIDADPELLLDGAFGTDLTSSTGGGRGAQFVFDQSEFVLKIGTSSMGGEYFQDFSPGLAVITLNFDWTYTRRDGYQELGDNRFWYQGSVTKLAYNEFKIAFNERPFRPLFEGFVLSEANLFKDSFEDPVQWPYMYIRLRDAVAVCPGEGSEVYFISVSNWGTGHMVSVVDEVALINGVWTPFDIPWVSFPPDVYNIQFEGDYTLFPRVLLDQLDFSQRVGLRITAQRDEEIMEFVHSNNCDEDSKSPFVTSIK